MSEVVFTFHPDGRQECKVKGAPGKTCKQASEAYLKALPGKVVSDTPTSEALLPPPPQRIKAGH